MNWSLFLGLLLGSAIIATPLKTIGEALKDLVQIATKGRR
jgi:hypothetical protein